MKDNTLTIALIAAGCFVIACVTGLTIAGRDASQVLYLVGTTLPATIAGVASLRASNRARNAADTAGSAARDAAEHAVNTSARQVTLSAQVEQLRAQVGGRRATDTPPMP